jgi:O-antigen biosynthesis protein WbqP
LLKRIVDVALAGAALAVLAAPLLLLGVLIMAGSPGPALHWSERVGRLNRPFAMPKLRTMRQGAPQLATHLFHDADAWTTPLGRLLRRTSLDELPQLFSVLKGDMSLVGPRPALFNQHDLVELRTRAGVHTLRPGLTGWAQVNGRDELSVEEKVRYDAEYLARRSLLFDVRIMLTTARRLLA